MNKLFAHFGLWKEITLNGHVPPPVLVSIDPSNKCNLSCYWCNGKAVQDGSMMDKDILLSIPSFLKKWGVKAVCIAGGGEPLLHPNIDEFLELLHDNEIQIGLITNGTMIYKHTKALCLCHFVGVSVDAGSKEIYKRLKGKDCFEKVIGNMWKLVRESKLRKSELSKTEYGRGVAYKYLITPENYFDVPKAIEHALEANCALFFARPGDLAWFDLDKVEHNMEVHYAWNDVSIQFLNTSFEEAKQRIPKDVMEIRYSTGKFQKDFTRKPVQFPFCVAGAMTCLLHPSTQGGLRVSLCCDRRGCDTTTLIPHTGDVEDLLALWGSKKHWSILKKIDMSTCPRCTYFPHMDLYFNHILNDNSLINFI